MPRVPTIGTSTARIGFVPTPSIGATVFEGLADLAGAGVKLAKDRQDEKDKLDAEKEVLETARQKDEAILFNSEATRQLSDLAANSEDPDAFARAAEDLTRTMSNDIQDPGVRAIFEAKSLQSTDALYVSLSKQAGTRQRTAAMDYMKKENIPNYALAIARARNAENDAEYERLMDEVGVSIASSSHFFPEQKAAMMRDVLEGEQQTAVQLLLNEATGNPEGAAIFLARAEALLDKTVSPDLSPKLRGTLRSSVATTKNAVKTALDNGHSQQQLDISTDLLVRLEDADPLNNPSEIEILQSGLDPKDIEHYIHLSREKAKGKDITSGITAIDIEVSDRVYNAQAFNRITTAEELRPFLSEGLGTDTFKRLETHLLGKAKAETKPFEDGYANFMRAIKVRFVNDGFVPFSDIRGRENYRNYEVAARKLAEEQRDAGVPFGEMFSFGTENSLDKIAAGFDSTLSARIDAALAPLDIRPEDIPFRKKRVVVMKLPEETFAEWEVREFEENQ